MTKISFFITKGLVGGNQILVSSGGEKLWLDFGLPLKTASKYINSILEGRQLLKANLGDLSRMKILPPRETLKDSMLEDSVMILLTHAHVDHYGAIPLLAVNNIRTIIAAPEDTLKLLQARDRVGAQRYLNRENVMLAPISGKRSLYGFEVIPIEVDHSIDASYSYILITPEGHTIYYTGDLRFDTISIDHIVSKIKEHTDRVDAVVTEFTGVYRRSLLREQDVEGFMRSIKDKYSGLVMVFLASSYTRRVATIASAFPDRELVVDSAYAYITYMIRGCRKGSDGLFKRVFIGKKERLAPWEKELEKEGFELVDQSYIEKHQKEVVLIIPPHKKLRIDFKLEPRSVAIVSLAEPFDEDSFIEQSKLERFLLEWRGTPAYHIHASGHTDISEIAEMIDAINPREARLRWVYPRYIISDPRHIEPTQHRIRERISKTGDQG